MNTTESEASSISNSRYEFEPFIDIFLRRREEVLTLVGVAGYALRSLEGMSRLSEKLRKPKEHVERVQEIEDLAKREVAADLPILHSAGAVLIWGALEASVRDFVIRWLTSHREALVIEALKNIRVKIVEYEKFDGEERMRYLVGVLERELGASLRPGIARFECLLHPFGIVPKVSDADRKTLNELAAVRNAIVHRAGTADARLIQLCPWLGLTVGSAILVGHEAFQRYTTAASHFAASIVDSAEELLVKEVKPNINAD